MKFIDTTIFIESFINKKVEEFVMNLDHTEHCTSVLVLSETYHKLTKKNIKTTFDYIRGIMGAIPVFGITQDDFFNAIKNPLDIDINDKIHIAVMKRNNVSGIISFDKGFDKEKTIQRMEP